MSDTVVEPYNATLSVHQLVENADECVVGGPLPRRPTTASAWGPCYRTARYNCKDIALFVN